MEFEINMIVRRNYKYLNIFGRITEVKNNGDFRVVWSVDDRPDIEKWYTQQNGRDYLIIVTDNKCIQYPD